VPHRPEIIAHRGASREEPENTIPAFARAMALGANAVELDVHRTADGWLVVHHDPGIASSGSVTPIQSLTLAAVRTFRVGGEPIPTLDDVVAQVAGQMRIYCELKGAHTSGLAAMRLAPLGERAAVHSFDHRMIAESASSHPDVPRGVLESSYHIDPGFPLRDVGARDLWQYESLIDRALVDAVHQIGCRVIAWTVNDPARATALATMGVDGICTDDVRAIRSSLD